MSRIYVILGVILFALVVIGASGIGFPKKSQPKYTGPAKKISVGNVREYSIFNILAKEKGIFSDNGLDANIQEYESGPAAIKDLLAGKVDMALASENAGVQTIFTNPELRIITQFVRNKVFSVIARKDKGIDKPADLRGKKVGVTKKSAGEFLFSQFLTFQRLAQKDLVIVDLPPSQIKTELQKGNIDAAVMFEPNIFDLLQIFKENAVVWPIEEGYYTFGLIYTTDAFIQSHPQLVQRYLQSLIEAEEYTEGNLAEAKELIGKTFEYSTEYIEYSWEKNQHAIGFDQELMLSMENIAKWSIENKLTDKTAVPNYLDYIYFDALEAVKPESVRIIH